MIRRLCGIDPGNSGALCVMSLMEDGSKDLSFIPMPVIDKEPDFHSLAKIFSCLRDCYAILEKVHAMPGQGVSSMFKFGRAFGGVQAMLAAHQIEYTEVTPQAWQKLMHEGISKEIDPKKRSLIAAQRLFPQANLLKTERSKVPDSGFVDALLLAEFLRLTKFQK